jgi:hypothetical protein
MCDFLQIQNQVKILESKLFHKENVIKALQSTEPAVNILHNKHLILNFAMIVIK